MHDNGDCDERIESGYLQSKYSGITEDEILDFHRALDRVPGVESFMRQGSVAPLQGSKKTIDKILHYHCKACWLNFDRQLTFGVIAWKPSCPNCGQSIYVERVYNATN